MSRGEPHQANAQSGWNTLHVQPGVLRWVRVNVDLRLVCRILCCHHTCQRDAGISQRCLHFRHTSATHSQRLEGPVGGQDTPTSSNSRDYTQATMAWSQMTIRQDASRGHLFLHPATLHFHVHQTGHCNIHIPTMRAMLNGMLPTGRCPKS